MKLNRRDFLKFLRNSTVAAGVVAVIGLPEIKNIEPDEPKARIVKLDGLGNSWEQVDYGWGQKSYAPIYAGGEFTIFPGFDEAITTGK